MPVPGGPSIAMVTPSFEQGDFVDATIASVMRQGYRSLDYVVQDGGSTDSTAAVLDRWGARGVQTVIEADSGQANAINRGFARVDGDVMGWLNSDDLLLPGALAAVADVFAARPDIDVVYGHRIIVDAEGRDIGRWIMPPHDDDILRWADYIPQETMFWRREIWEAAGGEIDESFRFAVDWDLIARFRDAGARFARIPRFLGGFRVHESQKTSAQMASTGEDEMMRLRERMLGRSVGHPEIHGHVRPYLVTASLYQALWKLGLVRYGA